MNDKANVDSQPKKISKEEAEQMDDWAQNLSDPITHVVDYGDLTNKKSKKKK
jgi:hypothetical protein